MSFEDLHVEMLPARTTMVAALGGKSVGGGGGFGGDGGLGGDGGTAVGGQSTSVSVTAGNVNFGGEQSNISGAVSYGGDASADGGSADGGSADGGSSDGSGNAAAAGDDQLFG